MCVHARVFVCMYKCVGVDVCVIGRRGSHLHGNAQPSSAQVPISDRSCAHGYITTNTQTPQW